MQLAGGRPLSPAHFAEGIPSFGLQFRLGDFHIWKTARGWRVARLVDGYFEPPVEGQFHGRLLNALNAAALLHRGRLGGFSPK